MIIVLDIFVQSFCTCSEFKVIFPPNLSVASVLIYSQKLILLVL